MGQYNKTVLDNGLRLVSEWYPRSQAVSIGIWVLRGSRDEASATAGITHFLEHLVFKGTKTRSAFEIAKSLEEVGGELNAYTTKEYTVFHALVLKDHWKRALDVLVDLVTNMNVKPEDFDLEKSVVLQELLAASDNHEDHIYDELLGRFYSKQSLGRPILGTEKSLGQIGIKDVQDYYNKNYQPGQIIISCAGAIPHEVMLEEVEGYFGKMKGKYLVKRKKATSTPGFFAIEKPSDQVHMLMAMPAASYSDKRRFEAFIFNALLGGGMTSRLYQNIREKKGLAYSIYSTLMTFTDTGVVFVYSAAERKHIHQLATLIFKELVRLKKHQFGPIDINMFKTQVTGSIRLASDDIDSRMTSLAVNEMVFGRYRPIDEVISEIQGVSMETLTDYIDTYVKLENLGGVLLGGNLGDLKPWWDGLNGQ